MKKELKELQKETPYLDAYKGYLKKDPYHFDVPGHKGNIKTDLMSLSKNIYRNDVNSPKCMGSLLSEKGAIAKAEELFATATNAKIAKFLINGSSSGNLAMFMAALKSGDKVLLPRNSHTSVINAVILSGATPVFVMPAIDETGEVSMQPTIEDIKKAIRENHGIKAIFIINPTYFGSCINLKKICDYAHKKEIAVLVDEAHGSHFYFCKKCPTNAIKAGADLVTLSMHKGSGSLTQTSALLYNSKIINQDDFIKSYRMMVSTSPNSMLVASLDAARKYMVFKGNKSVSKAIEICKYAIEKIKEIKGFSVLDKEYFLSKGMYDFDETKLVLKITKLKLDGQELNKILLDEYNIQPELNESSILLFLFSIGSTYDDANYLIKSLQEISNKYYDEKINITYDVSLNHIPHLIMAPRDAFDSIIDVVELDKAINKVSKETIMIYPPGIPIIIPGEEFDQNIINKIKLYQKQGYEIIKENKEPNLVSVVKRFE